MNGIIKDEKLSKQLEEDGIISFPIFQPDDLKYFTELFWETAPHARSGFFLLTQLPDFETKLKVHQLIGERIAERLNKFLKDYRALLFTMQVKNPDVNSMLPVHQDWSITDESQFRSYTLWIPLIDAD